MGELTKDEKRAIDQGLARVDRLKRAGDVDGLLGELESPEPRVPMEMAVLQALGKVGDSRAADRIIPLLQAEDPGRRLEAVIALGRIGTPNAAAPLVAAMNDPHPAVRAKAAEWLGTLGVEAARPRLIELLRADEWWERCAAAIALSKVGRPADTDLLANARSQERRWLRRRHFPKRVKRRR
jgi:HEAT repeat protein